MQVSKENKAIAGYVSGAFGGEFQVVRYWDEAEESHVDILTVENAPDQGVVSYATVGLSDTPLDLKVDGVPLGVELVMALGAQYEDGANILATCAFEAINSGAELSLGTILEGVVAIYAEDSPMEHVVCVSPVLWTLESRRFKRKVAAFLQAVPISEAEKDYAEEHGSERLEELFEEAQIDLYDLYRDSVV